MYYTCCENVDFPKVIMRTIAIKYATIILANSHYEHQ